MLENSVWFQYNKEKLIRSALADLYKCEVSQIVDNEGELYAILKRTMTKRELRFFAMTEAGISQGEIMEKLNIEAKDFDTMTHKSYRKIRKILFKMR